MRETAILRHYSRYRSVAETILRNRIAADNAYRDRLPCHTEQYDRLSCVRQVVQTNEYDGMRSHFECFSFVVMVRNKQNGETVAVTGFFCYYVAEMPRPS
jgi:hypothetical protein